MYVCIRLGTYLKMVCCCSWKPKQEMVLISELQKERKWHNDEFSQQSNCCPSLDAPKLSSEWARNLCVSLCLCGSMSGRVMMETVSIFSLWSCALHIVIHPVRGIPLLVWRENRHQSPIASYNQFMSFFHLWRVFIHFLRFSQLEFSDSGFCSTLCRRGKWDLGRSEDLFIMETPVC